MTKNSCLLAFGGDGSLGFLFQDLVHPTVGLNLLARASAAFLRGEMYEELWVLMNALPKDVKMTKPTSWDSFQCCIGHRPWRASSAIDFHFVSETFSCESLQKHPDMKPDVHASLLFDLHFSEKGSPTAGYALGSSAFERTGSCCSATFWYAVLARVSADFSGSSSSSETKTETETESTTCSSRINAKQKKRRKREELVLAIIVGMADEDGWY
eukprot:TRINITY_DN10398_c0_g1_i1.p1 TRINITY_DN10398_c0_g1~~TRINITY_DN10398_c0_g1_i1.p1  ORF type:complete len:213 (+),score=32.53 TRINITY_DN10398_c0_g1_i1:3-641(+)